MGAGSKIGNAHGPRRPAYLADKEGGGVGMAIYHLSAQIISRGGGRSVVAAQAYRAAERIHDERLGKTFDFTRKSGVEHSEIMLPEGAPAWMKDRKKLWNAVEKLEKRKDAQLAREVQVALPKELSKEAQVELAREFVKEHFVKHGMVADLAVHRDNPENPHAHITLGMREVTEDGFGKKDREWNSKGYLMGWRASWERCANRYLAREGHLERINHRSFADRGIQLEPTSKLGARLENAETDGREIVRDRFQEHMETVRRNGEAILKDPRIALDAITYQQATFTKREVGRWLNTRTADAQQFNACLEKVMASEETVLVSVDDDGRDRFTTKDMLMIEKGLVAYSKDMDQRPGHRVSERFLDQAEATRTLTYEQKNALRYIVEHTGDMAVVEGYAGTGKSDMLGAAREVWEAQGYRVLGASLAGKAAEGLEISSGIQSRSIHAWEYAWENGYERLGDRDVLVIDEAGMVGNRQLYRVIRRAKMNGAKVVLVGDTEQLQAIEAGAPMRATPFVWQFSTKGVPTFETSVFNDLILTGDTAGIFYALDVKSGEERWRFKPNGKVLSSPAFQKEVLYLGDDDGVLYALELKTGKEKWRIRTRSSHVGSPIVMGSTVYVASSKTETTMQGISTGPLYSYLHAYDIWTGAEKWCFGAVDGIRDDLMLHAGGVVFRTTQGLLISVDRHSGKQRWRINIGSRYGAGRYRVLFEKGRAFMLGSEKNSPVLVAVDLADGNIIWKRKVHGFSLRRQADLVTVSMHDGQRCFSMKTGKTKSCPSKPVRRGRSAVTHGWTAYYYCGRGYLCAEDEKSGKERWRVPVKGYPRYDPIFHEGLLYVTTSMGHICALDPKSMR